MGDAIGKAVPLWDLAGLDGLLPDGPPAFPGRSLDKVPPSLPWDAMADGWKSLSLSDTLGLLRESPGHVCMFKRGRKTLTA